MLWRAGIGISCGALVSIACGTETPRTFHEDAGLPAAPFNSYAPVVQEDGAVTVPGAEAGAGDAGGGDAGSADAGDAGGAEPAAISSALRAVAPFLVVLTPGPRSLKLESADHQAFTYAAKTDLGALFATKADALAKGELAHWTSQTGNVEISFRQTSAKVITAKVYVRGEEKGARELKFAAPEHTTLVVESRAVP